MAFRVQSRDVVVLGRFNPHIINPAWLRKVKICESDNDVNIEFGFNMDERRGVFQFTIGDFRWQVTDTRLNIGSLEGNPSEMAARVLEKLPHTPITAVGHNFAYRSESTEGMRLPQIGDLDGPRLSQDHSLEVNRLSWACTVQLANAVLNMKVTKLTNSVEVTTNIHREASSVEEVTAISEGFEKDSELSKKMVGSITGADI